MEEFISMKNAASRLGVKRPSLYHYVEALQLETKRFKLDRQTYLKMSDFENIQALRRQAAQGEAHIRVETSSASAN